MTDNLRTETIQVAAVAAAMIQDFLHGSTQGVPSEYVDKSWFDYSDETEFILAETVAEERYRQEEKWGAQHHHPAVWLTILMEEVAELAAEIEIDVLDMKLWAFVMRIASLEDEARELAEKYA